MIGSSQRGASARDSGDIVPKPFIQLFKTPRSQYVFDVNKNEMLPVSAESFDFLKQCMAGHTGCQLSAPKGNQFLA